MGTYGRGGAGNVPRVLEINEGIQLFRDREANRLSTKPASIYQAFAGDSAYSNVGRGGAGNFFSKSDASSVMTASSTFDPRAIPISSPYDYTAPQLTRPATAGEGVKPRKQSYRPVGRGGAGNFNPEVKGKTKTLKETWEKIIGRGKSRSAAEGDSEKGSHGSRKGSWWSSTDKDL